MSALTPQQLDGPADITIGPIDGGWAFWCATCRTGQAAKTGIKPVDLDLINRLADFHSWDHR